MKEIKIKYDGEYPNLCSGHLEVWLDDEYYDFGKYVLSSGGSCYWDSEDCEESVTDGEWSFREYLELPENFPEEYLLHVLKKINEEIPWGCCGGCL